MHLSLANCVVSLTNTDILKGTTDVIWFEEFYFQLQAFNLFSRAQ